MVDVERLVSQYLRSRTEVTDLVGQRTYTELPTNPTFPLIRLTLIDQTPLFSRPAVLANGLVQFDFYGGPKVDTRHTADVVIGLLDSDDFYGTHPTGTVTGVNIGGLQWLPDASYPTAKNRYQLDAEIFTRP